MEKGEKKFCQAVGISITTPKLDFLGGLSILNDVPVADSTSSGKCWEPGVLNGNYVSFS